MRRNSEKIFRDLRNRVARNVARFRAERGLTLMGLAERAGVHWRHVQKIEAGDSNPTLLTMARLADGLAVDAQELSAKPRKVDKA